jgi:TetR/AcrR family fatty acid metabolism transcriptional regulator
VKAKRQANRKSKKQQILEKAIEVFAHGGSNQTTIADIAKKANIAQGTIYVYFESKGDLLNECLQEIVDPVIKGIISATKDIDDPMDRLYEFFIQHITLVKEKPYIARFLCMEARQHEEFYAKYPDFNPLKQYLDYVKNTTEEAIAVGRIRALDAEAFSYLIVGAMDLVMSQWFTNPGNIDISFLATSIRDIIRHGTLPPD